MKGYIQHDQHRQHAPVPPNDHDRFSPSSDSVKGRTL
jgi:hypothetical protein